MNLRLKTHRLILRLPEPSDFEAWAALDADEMATRYIGGRVSREASWQGLATAMNMWTLRGAGLFSVLEANGGRWVGRVGPWLPERARGTEVGWAIDRSVWGRGYATEAAEKAIAWAFDVLGWGEVIHGIDQANSASIAVAQRLGSRWLRSENADGRLIGIYGQTREAWRARACSAKVYAVLR